jgi:hypothetical protein
MVFRDRLPGYTCGMLVLVDIQDSALYYHARLDKIYIQYETNTKAIATYG